MPSAYIFPQAQAFGAVFVGLDATPTGSDATADVVADFTGATATLLDSPSVAIPVIHTPSQTLGSTFKIVTEGIWRISARVQAQTAASVLAGLNIDGLAADFAIDPQQPDGTRRLDRALSISAGADSVPMQVSAEVVISRGMAQDPALGIVRLLLSNNAGAGAAAGSLLLASCFIQFKMIGAIPQSLAQ